MKGYKGFDPNMACRGKRYAENTTFEELEAEVCKRGMHFCENPLDVLDYYPLLSKDGKPNTFAEVEALNGAKTDDGKKFCTTTLKIGAKISATRLCEIGGEFLREKITSEAGANKTGNCAQQVGGDRARQIGGHYAQQVGGKNAIMVAGKDSKFKADMHSLIVACEYDTKGNLSGYKVAQVDGETVKPNTWYMLKDGEFVEVEGE